jgi:hypothetical protein
MFVNIRFIVQCKGSKGQCGTSGIFKDIHKQNSPGKKLSEDGKIQRKDAKNI